MERPWSGQLQGTTCMSKGCTELAPPLTGSGALVSWPYFSAAALGKVGPVSCPHSMVALVLVAGV